jgi:hypothetical protein
MTDSEAASIERTLGRVEEKIDGQCDRIEHIERTLNDPDRGVVANMAVLKTQMSEIRGADASAKTSKAGAVVAVGGGVTALVTLIAQTLLEIFGKK